MESAVSNGKEETRCLPARVERGELVVHARGPVPPVLLEAELASKSRRIDRVSTLLCEDALDTIQRQVEVDPYRVDLLYMAGQLLMRVGRLERALQLCRRGVDLGPCDAGFFQLSELLHRTGQVSESVRWALRAFEADPDHADYLVRLGYALLDSGRIDEGLLRMEEALDRRPNDKFVLQALLEYGHYVPNRSRGSFLDGYRRLGRLIAEGIEAQTHHPNSPEPDRQLRIGIICPFFRDNSVAYTFEPFLDGFDRKSLRVYGYANMKEEQADGATARMRAKFDCFRCVWGMPTRDLAALIQGDQIDILAEIGGYVRMHRLDVMACKPAPIQVDLGSVDTIGLSQIDYRVTDVLLDPPQWGPIHVETSVYLSGGSACYRPIQSPAQISPLPALQNGYVTFGAFHDHLKLNPLVFSLWARVLNAVDHSRLIIKTPSARDRGIVEWLLEQCQTAGLSSDRIEVMGWAPHGDHLSLYDRVDLMLDAFPFNGCITTLEGLWMGVPTVSLAGDLYVSRMGYVILARTGLEVFVAMTPDAYVDKAVAFARQPGSLAQIRAGLRQALLASPLLDPGRYASSLTAAFRQMWYRWCRSQGVDVPHEEPRGLFGDHKLL